MPREAFMRRVQNLHNVLERQIHFLRIRYLLKCKRENNLSEN